MIKLIAVEWTRFSRNPLNLWIVLAFLALLLISAIWSGLSARAYRASTGKPLISHDISNSAEMHDAAPKSDVPEQKSLSVLASAGAPLIQLPVLGGLVLNASNVDLLNTSFKISMRTRHLDGRNSDQLYNPVMHELGLLDFSTILALLTPLAIIALSYGLVQEDRERGVWRLVCTQTSKPWLLIVASLLLRYLIISLIIIGTSLLAFSFDPYTNFFAISHWLLAICLYNLVWFSIAGLFLLLPISSSASAIALLGVWLVLTFAVPVGLEWAANQAAKMPSRLSMIVDIRHAQELNAQQRQEILANWFASHPELQPTAPLNQLPQDIANIPVNLKLDSDIRALVSPFNQVKKAQFEFIERWSVLSPPLVVILMADRLAGIDAPRYANFVQGVNHFEDQWRGFLTPLLITNAQGAGLQKNIPVFNFLDINFAEPCFNLLLSQLITVVFLLVLLFLLRRNFAKA